MTAETVVPLMEAARQLRVGYSKALRMVLTGELEGQQRYGRWVVDIAALRKAKRKSESASEPQPER